MQIGWHNISAIIVKETVSLVYNNVRNIIIRLLSQIVNLQTLFYKSSLYLILDEYLKKYLYLQSLS